jgi:trehalose synthase-fused probable maltokinase
VTEEQALIGFVVEQRWFGSKTRTVAHGAVVDSVCLREGDPRLELQLVEIGFDTGTHETYQLLVDDGGFDALADPEQARELVRLVRSGGRRQGGEGTVELASIDGLSFGEELREARPIGAEQTNSSIVFDEQVILKVFRRLEAGINPELELLRFLTERGFENIARLEGWYAYSGRPMDATLGIVQEFVRGGHDGFERALDSIGGDEDDDSFLDSLHRLGEVTGTMHALLGSEPQDPNFSPEEPSSEALGLLTASVDDEIEEVFVELPDDNEALDPIRGRGEEVRDRLRLLSQLGSSGRVIRHHGDFHLGQTLWTGDDWVLLDFEGEPARSLPERRRKRSPLRDVAGMLRSFAYAAEASAFLRGIEAAGGWERAAREEFLEGYRSTVDPALVPSGSAMDKLLGVFELEKAVYELRYELNHRPDWVAIPAAGIARMLAQEVPV